MSFLGGATSAGEPNDTGPTDTVGEHPNFSIGGFLDGTSGDASGGNSGGDSDGFDPTIHVSRDSRNADGSFRKKRGRKSGSGASSSTRSKTSSAASVDALANILVILHAGISTATKTPEIAIDSDDANTLAKATANVLAEFDITPDPKVAAIVGLVVAAGTVYGPMAVSIRMRKDAERKQRIQKQEQGPYQ
jgi:hypothetical protein